MTPQEHYREAERLIADSCDSDGNPAFGAELTPYWLGAIAHGLLAFSGGVVDMEGPASRVGRLMHDLSDGQAAADGETVLAPVLNIPPRFDRKISATTSAPADAPAGADNGTTH